MKQAASLFLAAVLAGGFCAGCSSTPKNPARPKMAALATDSAGQPRLYVAPDKVETPNVKTPAESPAPGAGE